MDRMARELHRYYPCGRLSQICQQLKQESAPAFAPARQRCGKAPSAPSASLDCVAQMCRDDLNDVEVTRRERDRTEVGEASDD